MISYDYVFDFYKDQYLKARNRILPLLEEDELKVDVVKNGYVLPIKKLRGDSSLFGRGGVLDDKFSYVNESATLSRGGTTVFPMTDNDYEIYMGEGYDVRDEKKIEYIDEEVIYCGFLRNHWGHFLVDCTTRLWYAKRYSTEDRKCVFVVEYMDDEFRIIPNIRRFLELYGISINNVVVVNRVVQYKNVIIPQVSYRSNDFYSTPYLRMFDEVAEKVDCSCVASYKKIYFSRCNFKKAVKSEAGEKLILETMVKNGYHVVSPENCTLDEQIAYIRNADAVACINGTIAHNMLFARYGQKIEIVNKSYIMNMMQMDINIMKQLDEEYVDAYAALFPVSLGNGPFLIVGNNNYKNWVKSKGYEFPDTLSSQYTRKCIRFYIKKFRMRKLLADRQIKYVKNQGSVHYLSPELLMDFYENYYSIVNPIRKTEDFVAESIDKGWMLVMNIVRGGKYVAKFMKPEKGEQRS